MIEPPPFSIMTGSACLQPNITPRRFTAIVVSQTAALAR